MVKYDKYFHAMNFLSGFYSELSLFEVFVSSHVKP